VVFFQGCPHNCPGCHNPETHDLNGGTECSPQDILGRIAATKLLDGLTLSGGDPFMQPKVCEEIVCGAKKLGLNVWVYTGWTFEDLVRKYSHILRNIDVLVDGRFISELRSEDCLWRGSLNQRLVDVQASLASGETITIKEEK